MRSGFALGLILLRLLLLSGTALGAEIRKTPMVAPLEETGDGYLILKVRLHDRAGTSKAFRFLLDTGAATTMIDRSIPDGYFWDVQGIDAKTSDGNGKEAAVRAVTLKRVDVAGLMRDEVPAMRADLKNSMMGRMQDEPMDGILGMSFLRNTRFLLDAGRKRLTWSADFPEGQVHRIAIGPDDHAYTGSEGPGKDRGRGSGYGQWRGHHPAQEPSPRSGLDSFRGQRGHQRIFGFPLRGPARCGGGRPHLARRSGAPGGCGG